jgi:hypothetical protein
LLMEKAKYVNYTNYHIFISPIIFASPRRQILLDLSLK